jgi:hypothetical protein
MLRTRRCRTSDIDTPVQFCNRVTNVTILKIILPKNGEQIGNFYTNCIQQLTNSTFFKKTANFLTEKKSSTPENGSQNKTVPELAMIDLSWLFWLLKHFLYLTPSG